MSEMRAEADVVLDAKLCILRVGTIDFSKSSCVSRKKRIKTAY